jgi:ABC-2 type transport system permease protein
MKDLRVIAAVASKDFAIWLRRPVAILTTLTPTVMYVLVVYYISVDVGTPPIAVVPQSRAAHTEQLVAALRSSGGFRAEVVSASQAARDLASMKVAAVVTIPAATGTVSVRMNDLNADIAADLRRSLALAIVRFESAAGAPAPVAVSEHDTHATTASLVRFRLLPGLVLILSIAGVVNSGLATCQEFEIRTVKQLVLSPAPAWSLVAGKIIGGWLTTLLIAAFMWAIGLTTGLMTPAAPYLAPALLMSAVVGLAASSVGVAMGAGIRQFQLVTSLSVMVALYLFFLAGGVSVFGFLPRAIQAVSAYDPLYYAMHALEHVVLDGSLQQYLLDLTVMCAFAVAAAAVSAALLRRQFNV